MMVPMARPASSLTRRHLMSAGLTLPLAAAARRPNIVFILVDDLRWDELRCTGHPFAMSPNADRLAREGVNFRNAFATTPLCSPSRASFLTGKYPHRHGIIDNTDRSAASHELMTWPRTAARTGLRDGICRQMAHGHTTIRHAPDLITG